MVEITHLDASPDTHVPKASVRAADGTAAAAARRQLISRSNRATGRSAAASAGRADRRRAAGRVPSTLPATRGGLGGKLRGVPFAGGRRLAATKR